MWVWNDSGPAQSEMFFGVTSFPGAEAGIMWVWNDSGPAQSEMFFGVTSFPGAGIVSDIIEEQTGPTSFVPLPNSRVVLFDMATLLVAGNAMSASNGLWSISGVDPSRSYFAIAFHPSGMRDCVATQNIRVTS